MLTSTPLLLAKVLIYINLLENSLYAEAHEPVQNNSGHVSSGGLDQHYTHSQGPDDHLGNDGWSWPLECSFSLDGSQRYCVFTSVDFAEGRGLSIVTTPDHASEFGRLSAFLDPNVHQSLGVNQLTHPPFTQQRINDRGIGLVANRTIRRGESLMSFTPTFMIRNEPNIDTDSRLQLQRLAFQKLPNHARNLSYSLYGQSEDETYDLIEDILETNTFELDFVLPKKDNEKSETRYRALFPEIARFNHDCRPTADYYFDYSNLVLNVVAFRDIFPGEELTITYINILQRQRARQRALKYNWGFSCDCALCSASEEDVEASNARIGKIVEFQEEFEDRSSQSIATPILAEQYLWLLKLERLWTKLSDGYAFAATEYNGAGDTAKAEEYARLALQTGFLCRGQYDWDEKYRDMISLSTKPQEHPSWMFRVNSI